VLGEARKERQQAKLTDAATPHPCAGAEATESVQLKAYEVRPGQKLDVLPQLIYAEKGQTLIFTRTERGTERLAVAMIHGDRSQSQR
jgi:superfamily II DNA/RNA helicase